MEIEKTKGDILKGFCLYLSRQGVPNVVVGDTSEYPDHIESDVDIVVRTSLDKDIKKVVSDFAKDSDLLLVQSLQHEIHAWCFVFSWGNKSPSNSIALDICGDYVSDGKPLVRAVELLQGHQIAKTDDGDEKGFCVPAPEMEFIYYLLKKVDKAAIDHRQFGHLKLQLGMASEVCVLRMGEYWPLNTARLVEHWLQNDDLSSFARALPELKAALVKNRRPNLIQRAFELVRKARRVLQPTGLVITVLGPDGSGKSAVGDRLVVDLAPAFRGLRRFHLRPSFLGKGLSGGNGQPVVDPHGKSARSVLLSVAKIFYFLADYFGGYWARIRPLKVRSHLVLFDRYYHDLLIDPRRYRYGGPMGLAHFVSRFIPQPDLFLVLDAPAEVIHSRKQEVPLEETRRQRDAYLAFAASTPNCIVINTAQDIEETLREGRAAVLDFMARRVERRMGL